MEEWTITRRGGVDVDEEAERKRTLEMNIYRDLMRFKKLYAKRHSERKHKITRFLAVQWAKIRMEATGCFFEPQFDYPSFFRRRWRTSCVMNIQLQIANQFEFNILMSYLCESIVSSSRSFYWNIPSICEAFQEENLLVILNDDLVVGFIAYEDNYRKKTDVGLSSIEIFLHQRNRSIGRKAVQLFEEMMKTNGKTRILLEPIDEAEKFWKKAGYKETDSPETWYKQI